VRKRLVFRAVCAAFALALTAAIVAWQETGFGLGHWLQVHLGIVNEPGPYYGFFSGSGSDFGQLTDFAALCALAAGWWHRNNCHAAKCWRLGVHPVAGGQYLVCRRHHGDVAGHGHRRIPLEFLREKHEEHLERASCGCRGDQGAE
jgi:hypothetical protein